jgi:glycine C-acetyltransferase
MIKDTFSSSLDKRLRELREQGVSKRFEQVITGIKPAAGGSGPCCFLEGFGDRAFLRMNSNSYLGMSRHPAVVTAEEQTARLFGSGPGAVRFISGTYKSHKDLERQLADFHGRQDAMLFSAAYATVLGVLPPLISGETLVLSDELNHNCIINSIRLAKPQAKGVYKHLDMADLERLLQEWSGRCRRVLLVSDGIFSMRGDHAPLRELQAIRDRYQSEFEEGIVTVMDDSHGVGAFGRTGRGVEEYTGAGVDVLVATLGKAFGVNGGYVAADRLLIDYLRETSPLYIYSNPITPSEAAAASAALGLLGSEEGIGLLEKLRALTRRLERGLSDLGYEVLESEHPIVPLMVRDTAKTATLAAALFENNILVTGLNFPVVPKGDEEIRFQVSAEHTEQDIDRVLAVMKECRD